MVLYEPSDRAEILPDNIDLAIVPGLAFDHLKNRLGYGKGYYDRLLCEMDAYKIGVCFRFQVFDKIPYTNTDVKMDLIVSERDSFPGD